MALASLNVLERPPADGGREALVVAVHGTMDRSAGFAGVRRALADVRTIVYDRRGYGRSGDLAPAPTLDASVDDLLDLCAGRPAVVLGHSFGGCICLRAAERAPEVVRAVAVYEPPLPWLLTWPSEAASAQALGHADPEAATEAYMRAVVGDQRWEDLPERAKDQRRSEASALMADLRSVRPTAGQPAPLNLDRVSVPVVVGRGTTSPIHLMEGADRLVELLPVAERTMVEGAGHGAHTTHPDAIAAMVRQGLRLASL